MNNVCKVTVGAMLLAMMAPSVAFNAKTSFGHSAMSFTGTYFNTTNNGMSIGDHTLESNPLFSGNNPVISRQGIFINPENQFGYQVEYTYRFPGTDTRFFLSYEAFSTHDENHPNGHITNIEMPLALFFAPPIEMQESARLDHAYDDGIFGFSRMLHFGPRYHLDLQGFFEWNNLRRSLYETISGTYNNATSGPIDGRAVTTSRTTSDKMHGWGPGIGASAIVKPLRSLSWSGFISAKYSLLWVDNEYSTLLVNSAETQVNDYLFDPESSESVVGKLDIRFGLDFSKVFRTYYGPVLFQSTLGMRYMNIFNAFKNGNTAYNAFFRGPTFGTVNEATTTGFANDWGQMGPYFTFRMGGANA